MAEPHTDVTPEGSQSTLEPILSSVASLKAKIKGLSDTELASYSQEDFERLLDLCKIFDYSDAEKERKSLKLRYLSTFLDPNESQTQTTWSEYLTLATKWNLLGKNQEVTKIIDHLTTTATTVTVTTDTNTVATDREGDDAEKVKVALMKWLIEQIWNCKCRLTLNQVGLLDFDCVLKALGQIGEHEWTQFYDSQRTRCEREFRENENAAYDGNSSVCFCRECSLYSVHPVELFYAGLFYHYGEKTLAASSALILDGLSGEAEQQTRSRIKQHQRLWEGYAHSLPPLLQAIPYGVMKVETSDVLTCVANHEYTFSPMMKGPRQIRIISETIGMMLRNEQNHHGSGQMVDEHAPEHRVASLRNGVFRFPKIMNRNSSLDRSFKIYLELPNLTYVKVDSVTITYKRWNTLKETEAIVQRFQKRVSLGDVAPSPITPSLLNLGSTLVTKSSQRDNPDGKNAHSAVILTDEGPKNVCRVSLGCRHIVSESRVSRSDGRTDERLVPESAMTFTEVVKPSEFGHVYEGDDPDRLVYPRGEIVDNLCNRLYLRFNPEAKPCRGEPSVYGDCLCVEEVKISGTVLFLC